MERKIDVVYNSKKDSLIAFQIASGHISKTNLLFENEDVIAIIDAKGTVSFYNTDETLLATGNVPASEGGREVYEEVECQVKDNMILFIFPIYEWIDNYPHCDGEHDRWDTRKIGEHKLQFNLTTKNIEP